MGRIEIITAERLARELSSKRFIRGLEAAIDITERTGYESSFYIYKRLFGRKIVYPDYIDIGDEKSAGVNVGLKRAERRYREIEGKKIAVFKPRDKKYLRKLMDFIDFCRNEDEEFSIAYPKVERGQTIIDSFIRGDAVEDYHILITVHTHPTSRANPSEGDIWALNTRRILNQERLGLPLKPIGISIATKPCPSNPNEYDMFFIQEKTYESLDKEKLKRAITEISPRTEKERFFQLFRVLCDPIFSYHNILKTAFNKKTGKIHLPEGFKNFAFRYEAETISAK